MKKIVTFLFTVLILANICFSTENIVTNSNNPYIKNLTITADNCNELPDQLESNVIYYVDLNFGSEDFETCTIMQSGDLLNPVATQIIMPDESGHFKKKIYVSAATKDISFSAYKTDGSVGFLKKFALKPIELKPDPALSFDKTTGFYKLNINNSNIGNLPKEIPLGALIQVNIDLEGFDQNICEYYLRLTKGDPMDPQRLIREDNLSFSKLIFIPSTTRNFVIQMKDENYTNNFIIGYFSAVEAGKPYKFATPKSYDKAFKYKTNKIDERILNYLVSINAREKCKEDPESVLKLCVSEIEKLAENDFEKIKLINDAIWYLVSYDIYNATFRTFENQDYITNLKTGKCVCEGFAKLFNRMCDLCSIPCIEIWGRVDPKVPQSGHAWNAIQIKKEWYLVDITWGCSFLNLDGTRNDTYSTDYLFNTPDFFVTQHVPLYKELQLLKKPINPKGYYN